MLGNFDIAVLLFDKLSRESLLHRAILRAGLVEMFCGSRIHQNSAINHGFLRILANPATRHFCPRGAS
ncbi:MAG: hypothetical protein DWI22_06855 [Planctomycetota bacterium]|nr:MAG: hypothetical protein DWI22_06855 [Planctomycetota bacterium]